MASPDNFEKSTNPTTGEKKKPTILQLGAVFLAAVSLAGTLGAGGCAAKTPEVNTPTTTETPATKTEAQKEHQYPTDEYIESMNTYKVMDIDEFEQLPRKERVSYGQYLIDFTEERGLYDKIYASYPEFKLEDIPASINNSGQEIVDIYHYKMQMGYAQSIEGNFDRNPPIDKLDAKKAINSIFYETGIGEMVSNGYTYNRELTDTLSIPVYLKDTLTSIGESSVQTGSFRAGEEVQYKDITLEAPDGTTFDRYVYYEYTDYKGEKQATWLLEYRADTQENLLESSSIK